VGLRPTNNNVAGTKIGRSGSLFAHPVFHISCSSSDPNAAAGICEMASSVPAARHFALIAVRKII
jgi:hypothetical protein